MVVGVRFKPCYKPNVFPLPANRALSTAVPTLGRFFSFPRDGAGAIPTAKAGIWTQIHTSIFITNSFKMALPRTF